MEKWKYDGFILHRTRADSDLAPENPRRPRAPCQTVDETQGAQDLPGRRRLGCQRRPRTHAPQRVETDEDVGVLGVTGGSIVEVVRRRTELLDRGTPRQRIGCRAHRRHVGVRQGRRPSGGVRAQHGGAAGRSPSWRRCRSTSTCATTPIRCSGSTCGPIQSSGCGSPKSLRRCIPTRPATTCSRAASTVATWSSSGKPAERVPAGGDGADVARRRSPSCLPSSQSSSDARRSGWETRHSRGRWRSVLNSRYKVISSWP